MARVSVITASYNYEDYIKETIESVINQTFQDWEMIIVDDGSKDNSVEVIKSYCEKDSRIKLYQHENGENRGLAETLKLGISKAQSEWIAFLESDDTFAPEYLEEKFNIADKHNEVDFIFNDINTFGDKFVINKYNKRYLKDIDFIKSIEYPTDMLKYFQQKPDTNLVATFSAVMIKKKLFENIDFNCPRKPYLDWYLWLQVVNKKAVFYYIDKKLTNWRMHKSSYVNAKYSEDENYKFELKKSILLSDYKNVFKLIESKCGLKYWRRKLIRIHFNEGELHLFERVYQMPFLKKIASREVLADRTRYRVLGFKITVKSEKKEKKYTIDLDEVKSVIVKYIEHPYIEYVSFDIFDTLLVRPCIQPTDLFALIAEKVDSLYGIDFYSMRINAEDGLKNADIYQIYDAIQEKYNLSNELKNILFNEEIEAEARLLYPREDVKKFYDLAVKNQKKIIAVSDMYLPSEVLLKILREKGYDKISQVFVSNEYDARKEDGKLFDIVIDKLVTDDILHIGDNKYSDYLVPQKKKIHAIYYPKVIDILSEKNDLLASLIRSCCDNSSVTANRNILLGFAINNYWFNHANSSDKMFDNLTDFVNLFLAPYLCFITLCMQRNAMLQSLYKKIYFVARDGYLPNKIYKIMNDGKYIPSEYIYGSRVAYWTGTYTSIYDLLKKNHFLVSPEYTFEDFVNAYITEKEFNNKILSNYSDAELNVTVNNNYEEIADLISKTEDIFKAHYDKQKHLSKAYYENIFKDENPRVVVWDVGYSGSVSCGLSKFISNCVDKIYIHETPKNIYCDNKNQTYTYILKNGIESHIYDNLDLLLEETFSPLEGTCTGFVEENNEIKPMLGEMNVSKNMELAHKEINDTAENFAKKLVNLFGNYMCYLNVTDINSLIGTVNSNFIVNEVEKEIFSDIVYVDTATLHKQVDLAKKIRA